MIPEFLSFSIHEAHMQILLGK